MIDQTNYISQIFYTLLNSIHFALLLMFYHYSQLSEWNAKE